MMQSWQTEIPSGWKTVPFGSIFKQRKEKNSNLQSSFVLSVMKDRGVIPYAEKGNVGNKVSDDLSGYKIVKKGDFVLNSMNLYMGSVGVSTHDGITSIAYIVCEPSRDVEAGFYNYLIQLRGFQEHVGLLGKGIMEIREAVRWTALKSVAVPCPDLPTQRRIASFLDRETSRIDTLIAKKEKLNLLLAEKRAAVITAAVTGALDDPQGGGCRAVEGGSRIKLKQACSIYGDYGLNISADEYTDTGLPMIRTSDMDDLGNVTLENAKFVNPENATGKMLEIGDLLFSRAGTIGRCMKYDLHDEATFAAYLVRFRCKVGKSFPDFVKYWSQSHHYWHQIRVDTVESTIGNFNASKFSSLYLPDIDLATQRSIAAFLDQEAAKIDDLTAKNTASTEKLREYRAALITAAVTGQIDVDSYGKTVTPSATLDRIEEEMQA